MLFRVLQIMVIVTNFKVINVITTFLFVVRGSSSRKFTNCSIYCTYY